MLTLIREEAALIAFETALFAFLSASSKVTKSFCSKISMSISRKPKLKSVHCHQDNQNKR